MKKIIKSFVALFVVSLVVVNVNAQLASDMPASKAQKTTEESKVTKPVVAIQTASSIPSKPEVITTKKANAVDSKNATAGVVLVTSASEKPVGVKQIPEVSDQDGVKPVLSTDAVKVIPSSAKLGAGSTEAEKVVKEEAKPDVGNADKKMSDMKKQN